jgi:uncharacterized protein with FMN-binding domain
MRPGARRHPAPYALLTGLAITGCGEHKVQRSNRPATITIAATGHAAGARTAHPKLRAGTFAGQDVVTKYGDVQVSITVRRGRIVAVQPIRLPVDRKRSQYISQHASPILRSEVLVAQSARVNLVSGATYTSEGWANSVQSALNRNG